MKICSNESVVEKSTNRTILIAGENEEVNKTYADYFKNNGFNVVGITSDGNKALRYVESFKPQYILLGLMLTSVDGLEVLRRIQQSGIHCNIIVQSMMKDNRFVNEAISCGAKYFFTTPLEASVIKDRFLKEELVKDKAERSENKKEAGLDEKIRKIFLAVGIPPHIKGYAFLKEGVKLTIESPKIINSITKELYPKIAEIHLTTASKVERAIRHAIEVAWNRNRLENINMVFGVRSYVGSEKPTNGEFIALVAEKILFED